MKYASQGVIFMHMMRQWQPRSSPRMIESLLEKQAHLHECIGGHDSGDGGQARQQIAGVDCIAACIRDGGLCSCMRACRLSGVRLLFDRLKGPAPEWLLTHQASKWGGVHASLGPGGGARDWRWPSLIGCRHSSIQPHRAASTTTLATSLLFLQGQGRFIGSQKNWVGLAVCRRQNL